MKSVRHCRWCGEEAKNEIMVSVSLPETKLIDDLNLCEDCGRRVQKAWTRFTEDIWAILYEKLNEPGVMKKLMEEVENETVDRNGENAGEVR